MLLAILRALSEDLPHFLHTSGGTKAFNHSKGFMDVAITHSPFITALHLFDTIEHLQPKGQRKE
jgi:hypothetical protein